jgi:hypothetical protein
MGSPREPRCPNRWGSRSYLPASFRARLIAALTPFFARRARRIDDRLRARLSGHGVFGLVTGERRALILAMSAVRKPNRAAPHAAPPPDSPTTSTLLTCWEK